MEGKRGRENVGELGYGEGGWVGCEVFCGGRSSLSLFSLS